MNAELFDTFISQAEKIRRLREKHTDVLSDFGKRILLKCELAKWQDARDVRGEG